MSDQPSETDSYAPHPEDSDFPTAGERVSDEDRQRALDAEPGGNATVGDMVDTDAVDSQAEEGVSGEEVAEQARGAYRPD
jgi:hypothetical protein